MAIEMNKFGRVAVLYGGDSAEREVSLNSGQAIFNALQSKGVDVVLIDAIDDVVSKIQESQVDRIFIALHGAGGEDGRVQALLEFLKLPFTGSGVQASALAMDKWFSKQIFTVSDIPTPKYCLLTAKTDLEEVVNELGEALMIKPAHEGSSIGMSKISAKQDLLAAYETAAKYDTCVFAEQVIVGNEYTVTILNGQALPVIKLETDHLFYDYDAKYISNDTRYICPCGLKAEQEKKIQDFAVRAFESLGCLGWGRVDFMADEESNFYVLEVNTVPGMTDHSLVPMAAKHAGIQFDDLVIKILSQTLVDKTEA
jgi:D-alanine-D-alanine ligase